MSTPVIHTGAVGDEDGFAIVHHRATDTLYFGPFARAGEDGLAEVREWLDAHPESGGGVVVALYRTVDWNR